MDLEQPESRPQPGLRPQDGPGSPEPVSSAPVAGAEYTLPDCHRHPGRETGVRCTRCDRPVCPDCRVDAAVGFQCRDCVQGRGRAAAAVGPAGDGTVAQPPAARPRPRYGTQVRTAGYAPVTKLLIAANVLVYLVAQVRGGSFVNAWVMWGYGVADQGQWYRMVTSVFLHQQIWHIAMNMWSLWVLGPLLESALGRVRFLALYLLSGLAGSALFLLLAAPQDSALGASGAVFGLLGGLFVLFRKRQYQLGQLVAVLVVNLVATFAVAGIAWQDHVGGLVAGALVAWGFLYAPSARRIPVQVLTVVAVALVVTGLSLYGVAQIPG